MLTRKARNFGTEAIWHTAISANAHGSGMTHVVGHLQHGSDRTDKNATGRASLCERWRVREAHLKAS